MSFANEKRADPHKHFRTEPGYRGLHDHSAGMTDEQVKATIGEDRWPEFLQWMRGQTVGLCPKCRCPLTYLRDIDAFTAGGKVWD